MKTVATAGRSCCFAMAARQRRPASVKATVQFKLLYPCCTLSFRRMKFTDLTDIDIQKLMPA
jgi:hypothetical protein